MSVAPPSAEGPRIVAAPALPRMAFVEARWYRRGLRRDRALWIVLHATHGAEHARAAEDGAAELARIPANGRKRSAHVFVDSDSIVQCVPWECEAWHAGATANRYGVGIELCGRADQTAAEWHDPASLAMLGYTAHLLSFLATQLAIPLRAVTATQLRAHMPGITTHADVTRAFPSETDHTDPGPHFPLAELLEAARAASPS